MIINDESPLKRFPASSENRQTLFFDGIRYSIEMAALAYDRLFRTLFDWTVVQAETLALDFVPAFLDAWSIVDSVHRLRMLVNQTPGVKKKATEIQLFDKGTAPISELRNYVQHIDHETRNLVGQNTPVWGVLSWCAIMDEERKSALTCFIQAGSRFQSNAAFFVNPLGKKIKPPIDLITLTAYNVSVCLSDVVFCKRK